MRKNISQLRDVLQRGGEYLKGATDCGVTAICLALEDHQAETSAGAGAEVEKTPAPSSNNDEPLLTAVELESYIKLRAATIRDWSRKGRIPFELVGRERRYRLSVIKKWIDENKLEQSSP